jgi:signal transduction histidine kinase
MMHRSKRFAMPAIASRPPEPIDLVWGLFAAANLGAMLLWPNWETVPFHFIWVSLTLLYGFRVWPLRPTAGVLALVIASTGVLIFDDAAQGTQEWGELFEVPLMSAMFLAMVWHGRRRQHAMDELARLAERQERFLQDASHELRTPIAIARGHLELARNGNASEERAIALDELRRMESIVERLLLLAKADQPDFMLMEVVELEPFLEDLLLRWSEIAPRAWRVDAVGAGTVVADVDALRIALDALLENAVKYTSQLGSIEVRARGAGEEVVIAVADDGCGIPEDARTHVFERFARADPARSRTEGGVGLGLAIVDTIARAHGGRCDAVSGVDGTVVSLHLPGWRPSVASLATSEPERTSR